MIPLRDNLPTARFPIVTVVLILANVAVFIWQVSHSSSDYSSEAFRGLDVTEFDENAIEYGAIPYRVLHPGKDCAVGAVPRDDGRPRAEIACEGTSEYEQAEQVAADQSVRCRGGEPCGLALLDGPAWWITVFASIFMHGGILHIAGNMLFLWVFGNNIEDAMGPLRFVLFYLLAGVIAVYAQSLLDPSATEPTIGASGAVSGVLGAYILLHPKARVLTFVIVIFFFTFIEIPAVVLLAIWFVLQALPVFGQLATPEVGAEGGGIAYLAHVAGFLFGLAAIKLFARKRDEEDVHPATGLAT